MSDDAGDLVTRLDDPDDDAPEPLGGRRGQGGGGRLLLGGLVVAVAAAALLSQRGGPTPTPAPAPAPTSDATPTPSAAPVIELGRRVDRREPLLGVTAGWEVFALGPGGVVRIQPAAGVVTQDEMSPLASTGPVAFVPGATGVMVRPYDPVPGYLIDDEKGAVALPPVLQGDGLVIPGRNPDRIWVGGGAYLHPELRLTDFAGTDLGVVVHPDPPTLQVSSDGGGGLLATDVGGVYRVQRAGKVRVTPDLVTAVGPTRLLATECGRSTCSSVVIDQRSGARRRIGGPISDIVSSRGVISADGATAALPVSTADGTSVVYLVDLTTGRTRELEPHLDRGTYDGGLAWSPDGRWLFMVATGQRLLAVAPATGRTTRIDVPPVTQVAVRP